MCMKKNNNRLLPVLPEGCFLQSQSAGQWVLCCSGVGLGAGVSFS